MATKDKETPLDSFNTDIIVSETTALSQGVMGLIPMTKTQKGLKQILADEHARRLLTQTMTTFVSVDMRFDVGMRAMGEILSNLLKQPVEIQRKAVEAICEAQGIPAIEFNEKAPRNTFAMALFAKFPEMQQMVKGGKDTKGALRLTSYMSAYKLALNPAPGRGRSNGASGDGDTNPQPRTAYDLFIKVFNVATAKERPTLLKLCQRAEIEFEKWLPKDETADDEKES